MKKKVVIIGAGTIGLHCAYFLQNSGHEVEIIESLYEEDENACSYGNCGLIVPSHFVPLASPAMLKSGLKMIFDNKSPVHLPVVKNISNIPWFLKFLRAANQKKVDKVVPTLFRLNEESKILYREINSQHKKSSEWQEKGLLMVSTSAKGFREEIAVSKIANELGIETEILDAAQLKAIEPGLNFNVEGAVWYKSDAHLQPAKHLQWLKKYLQDKGVKIHYQTRLLKFKTANGKIKQAETHKRNFLADEFVLAAGVFSKELVKNIGISLPLLAGKGYSIDFPDSQFKLKTPVILTEAKVALTPFGDTVRLGSGMEFNCKIGEVNLHRIQTMLDRTHAAISAFPKVQAANLKIWEGLRPLTPDGVPLIGRTKLYKNLLVAGGHAMMGVSLAPVTGKIITDFVDGKSTGFQDSIFSPNRF